MKWFGRTRHRSLRPAMRKFSESELPPVPPFSLDEAASEGLMLAEYSSRLRLKNRIIVMVLTSERAFDASQYLEEARAAIAMLVHEFDLESIRIARQLRVAKSVSGKASHAHDYRSADAHNLQHRADVLSCVIEALRKRQEATDYLLGLIESARNDAWGDVAKAVEDWLDRSNILVDADYKQERKKRMHLVSEDLSALQASSAP